MNRTRRTRLEARGWKVGTAAAFLELSPEEAGFVETRLALRQALRRDSLGGSPPACPVRARGHTHRCREGPAIPWLRRGWPTDSRNACQALRRNGRWLRATTSTPTA